MRIISLFCGCGGADLGISGGFNYLGTRYTKNAVEFVHASDIDPKAIATYNSNFSHDAQVADIRDLSFKHLPADLVVGGFPCQSFSSVNPTKNPTDSRGQLFNDMIRVVRETKPKYVIGENVKGFYRLHQGAYFHDFASKLRRAGYEVYHQVMNAADFGVPQLRQRLIVVGVRRDIPAKFNFPDPLVGPKVVPGQKYTPLRAIVKSLAGVPDKYYFSKRAVEGVKRAKPNMKRALAQDLDEPCLTVTSHLAKVSLNSRDPVLLVKKSAEVYRRFTPCEAAAIQAFPETFHFVGSEADAYRQIGNAIPPVLMWHVFKSIRKLEKNNNARR